MEEEISLRELIEVLLKGKKLIALITIISIALGTVVAFTQPKVYEAKATLLTNPINSTKKMETDTTSLNGLIDSMSQYPQMDINTYKEQFLSSDVVSKTIHELNLVNKDGSYMSMRGFREKVTVDNPKDTNLLTITVKDKDPELAANIANSLCTYFAQFISELNRAQGLSSSEAILAQMELEKGSLDTEAKKLRDYLAKSQSIEALNSEITELIAQLSQYKTDLNDVQTNIATDNAALEVLLKNNKAALGLNTGDVKVNIPTDTDTNTTSFELSLDSSNKLQGSLLTMEVTNTETRLNSNMAKETSLTTKITEVEAELAQLQANLAEEQYKYNAIKRDYDLAEQTYNSYQEKYKEALITAASDIGRVSIQISSSAVAPQLPSGTSKIMILGIAGVLGLMVGAFVVFFKAYWDTSAIVK